MIKYTVKKNDNLWNIALDHGFKSEQVLLKVQENKDFFASNKRNEFRLYEGDIIHIPEKNIATLDAKVNGKRVFRTPSKKGFIRLKVNDVHGKPVSDFKYEATFDGQDYSGDQSSHGGDIEVLYKKSVTSKPGLSNTQTGADRPEQDVLQLKLFVDSNNPKNYEEYRVHIGLDPNDKKEGQLQKSTNEGIFSGYIPKATYEKNLGKVGVSCYPDDEWTKQQFESMQNNGADLSPIPAPINFQPQYYPVVWEMLRYERLFKLADIQVSSLEKQLEVLKENKEPFDTTNSHLLQGDMDKEYYQYCFTYWSSEYSSLWNAHIQKDFAADALARFRSHILVDEQLKEVTKKWREGFESETVTDVILEKPFPEIEIKHTPVVKDIFTTFYSTQQTKDKLYTTIVSPPLTSRVCFSYQDDPETPIANSYVLYWRYDKADTTKLETGRDEFYNNARIMMPIGIGKTDSNGYLVQSLPFDDDAYKAHMKIDDGHFTMHAGMDELEGLSHDYLQPFMAKFESSSDAQKYIDSVKPLEDDWNDVFNIVNKKSTYTNLRRAHSHIRREYKQINDSENYDGQVNKLMAYADERPERYKFMRSSIANHKFNYYSSGSQDTWGFMVYPPDAGLVRTGDLAKLGNEGTYVYKGPINAPSKQGDYIQLPCTLQEWERRLKIHSEKLKIGLNKFQKHTTQHRQNIEALGRMDGLLNLYENYPYENEEEGKSTAGQRTKLKTKVNTLSSAISDLMKSPDSDKDKGIHGALKAMDLASEEIIKLLKSSDFADQLDLYQKAHQNKEKSASPYMEFDETWTSVYTVIADTIGLLALCPKADDVYANLIQPVMDNLINSEVVTSALTDGVGGLEEVADGHEIDTLAVNHKNGRVEESLEELMDVVNDKYSLKQPVINNNSVLDKVFESQFYNDANDIRKGLNKWVNNTPGTPSVLIALLEGYMTYITADAQKHGGSKGYHIRLLMMISEGFGLFSGAKGASKAGILGVLKSNSVIRLGTKIEVQKGLLMQVDNAVSDSKRAIASTEKQIAEVEGLLNKSKKSRQYQLNSRLKRLKKYLKDNQQASDTRQLEIKRMLKVQTDKQMGVVTSYNGQRQNASQSHANEFYQHADGQLARVYKTTLTAINVAAVVEDWLKVSRAWKKQELGQVHMDIVMVQTLSTVCETAKTSASAILLVNRWVGSDSKLFGNTSWLKNATDGLDKFANKAAVGVSILSLYVSSRELYESYNNTLMLEQIDSYLSIAADAMTLIGHLALNLNIASLAWLPVIGQILMVIGAVLIIVQLGYHFYTTWVAYKFIEKGPVGFYFWQEFKKVRDNSQRYANDDFYLSDNEPVVGAFKDVFDVADGNELQIFEDHEGWGHLSWRAVVVLYRQWRNLNMTNSQLEKMIEDICRVPSIIIDKEVLDQGTRSTTKLFKLISPVGMLSFYQYIEKKVESEPEVSNIFESSGLSYRAVMNLMEQGLYVPKGEADEILSHIKSDFIVNVSGSGQMGRHKVYEHRVVWEHDFYTLQPSS